MTPQKAERSKRIALFVVLSLLGLTGLFIGLHTITGSAKSSALEVTDAWMRPSLAGMNGGVYVRLHNRSDEPVVVMSAQSEGASRVEIHRTVLEEVQLPGQRSSQVMKMEPVANVEVPPYGTVLLAPGGLHIMLIGLTRDFAEGDSLTLNVRTSSGDVVTVDVAVAYGPGGEDDHHDHHQHH